MTDPNLIAEQYLAMWNEPDPEQRRRMLAAGWASDALYVDPLLTADGTDALAATIDAVRDRFAGHGFTLAGKSDGHGRFVRFSWTLAPEGGAPVTGGTDIVRLDGQGRIVEVIGFLDGGRDA